MHAPKMRLNERRRTLVTFTICAGTFSTINIPNRGLFRSHLSYQAMREAFNNLRTNVPYLRAWLQGFTYCLDKDHAKCSPPAVAQQLHWVCVIQPMIRNAESYSPTTSSFLTELWRTKSVSFAFFTYLHWTKADISRIGRIMLYLIVIYILSLINVSEKTMGHNS